MLIYRKFVIRHYHQDTFCTSDTDLESSRREWKLELLANLLSERLRDVATPICEGEAVALDVRQTKLDVTLT